MSEKEAIETCSICGKDLNDGDKALALTLGEVSADCNGFVPGQDTPWLSVWCEDCKSIVMDTLDRLPMPK